MRNFSPKVVTILYFFFGLIQTLIAYYLFARAGDHDFFLLAVNEGIPPELDSVSNENQQLKTRLYLTVMYLVATPSRILGGNELVHLLWFKFLVLVGFYMAFIGMCRIVDDDYVGIDYEKSRRTFFWFTLLYPGQLAWTASLLRDGISCFFLGIALYYWTKSWKLLAMIFMCIALLLRSEFVIIFVFLVFFKLALSWKFTRDNPIKLLFATCGVISILLFDLRRLSAELSNQFFGEVGMPQIESILDIKGYFFVLLQALADPVSILNPADLSVFKVLDVVFFNFLMFKALIRIDISNIKEKVFLLGSITCLWFFAYFEVLVSGFSRHRLMLVVMLLVIISIRKKMRVL